MQRGVGFVLIALAGAPGCNDVERFSTSAGESYCGRIVPSNLVRRGFADSVCMRMTFDSNRIGDMPGQLWTDDGLLTAATLRPIPELAHDPLFTFSFGEGRHKNFLLVTDPTAGGGATLMVALSLMHTGEVEVRLIRGAPGGDGTDPTAGMGGPPLFALFAPLRREQGTCSTQPGCKWKVE
jgi:hypothetical protein